MKIIIFQGNYPAEYSGTRHNIAFDFADFFAKKNSLTFIDKPKFFSSIAETIINGEKILLVKPQTFYNETGKAASSICNFYKIDWKKDLCVFCDDLDLNFGEIRARLSGSPAGNNGLKSIISTLGTGVSRVKIGIKNELFAQQKINPADFVLSHFSITEKQKMEDIFITCESFLNRFISEDLENHKQTV